MEVGFMKGESDEDKAKMGIRKRLWKFVVHEENK